MEPLAAFWHVTNFFGPALGLGLIASALAKLLWRRELARSSWIRLAAWSCGAAALAALAGLLIGGRDGLMATYASMVAACALALWWAGFVQRP
jgi:hypothetical protein